MDDGNDVIFWPSRARKVTLIVDDKTAITNIEMNAQLKLFNRVWITSSAIGIAVQFALPLITNGRCKQAIGLLIAAMGGLALGAIYPGLAAIAIVFSAIDR